MGGRPVRVLYSFPHTLGAPGIGTTALNQARGLIAAGADVTVVCASVPATIEMPRAIRTLQPFGHRIPHRLLGGVDAALRYHDRAAAAIARRGAFDAVHTWPLAALETLRTARGQGVVGAREAPNSHTAVAYRLAEEESTLVGIALGSRSSHSPNAARLARELDEYAAASIILAPSAHVERSFLEQGIPASVVRRHRYGFDDGLFSADGRDDAGGRPFTALFLGSAEPRKGLHYALAAWHRSGASEDGRFLIAGRFVPGYRDFLGSLLDHPSVTVLGFISDTPALLRSADVLLLPSVEEGSALVTYEALASGCIPLVSTAAGAALVDGREGLLHEPRDVAALAGQIRRVREDADLRRGLRTAGLAAAESLTWTAAGVHLLNVLSGAVTQKRA